MPSFGVSVAVINDGKILLTRREDFEVWCIPGGALEDGESLAEAARREIREETGLDVELERLVGIYSAPQGPGNGRHILLFAGKPVGGQLDPLASEVIEMGYFGPDEIPEPLLRDTRRQILDVFAGAGGSLVRSSDYAWPFDPNIRRAELYRMRDESGLGRQEFYLRYFGTDSPDGDRLEVGTPLQSTKDTKKYL